MPRDERILSPSQLNTLARDLLEVAQAERMLLLKKVITEVAGQRQQLGPYLVAKFGQRVEDVPYDLEPHAPGLLGHLLTHRRQLLECIEYRPGLGLIKVLAAEVA